VRIGPLGRLQARVAARSRRSRKTESRLADPRLLAFARGLAIGALIGAAIAGSSIWRRSRRRDERSPDERPSPR
jgi:hypothetical protein